MVETIQAQNINLLDLSDKFGLQLVEDEQFFRDWGDELPEITEFEKQFLDQVKASYLNLLMYPPMLENTVKMVVLSPLLQLAGFYLPPFHIKSEPAIQIAVEDENTVVKGNIDVLVLQRRLWVLVIESKRQDFSLAVGVAQILAYMLANPNSDRSTLGMLTNGGEFQFVKLTRRNKPQYAFSQSFNLRNPGNELYAVLSILKRLAQILSI
ncbi:MAG TPA: restriction endonuclease subunit R [Cyanobacteria bacterium UBA8553]|nr:restriction endonuclease subunit R [Cyanobacteria bacterium UBA8553]HAJ60026.1 restriction endonuclease subunit R [Cyanobacteria bacterium UBA8543]